MNRFKGLDPVDRACEELWTEVHNTAQEMVTKIIPKKNKYKKAKWLSEDALQIAKKIREAKGKWEKKQCTQLNIVFQKIARRHKKALLSEQCMEIEENIRMVKTSDHFKKMGSTREYFNQGWAR